MLSREDIHQCLQKIVPELVDPDMVNHLVTVFEKSYIGNKLLELYCDSRKYKKLFRDLIKFLYTTFPLKIETINRNYIKIQINPESNRFKITFQVDKNFIEDQEVVRSLFDILVFIGLQFIWYDFQDNEADQIVTDWKTFEKIKDLLGTDEFIKYMPREWQIYYACLKETYSGFSGKFFRKRKAKKLLKECPDIIPTVRSRLINKRSFFEKVKLFIKQTVNIIETYKEEIIAIATAIVIIVVTVAEKVLLTELI